MPTVDQARSWYAGGVADDPVHGFDHVLRVYRMAERLALAEGADLEIVRAAALLHDATGSVPTGDDTERATHQHASADFAAEVLRAESWPAESIAAVQHAIRAHRFRDRAEPPTTLEARILFDADKLDAIGAIGVARSIAFATQAGCPAYAPPSPRFLETGELEPGEPHSAYHEYVFKLIKIKDLLHTPSARVLGEARHARMARFFEGLRAEFED